jgi:hypothetical protein
VIATSDKMLTPPQLARRYGVKAERVIGWIRSGELRAIDLASKGSTRPRFRIDPKDIELFELRRSVQPAVKTMRRKRTPTDVTAFF